MDKREAYINSLLKEWNKPESERDCLQFTAEERVLLELYSSVIEEAKKMKDNMSRMEAQIDQARSRLKSMGNELLSAAGKADGIVAALVRLKFGEQDPEVKEVA